MTWKETWEIIVRAARETPRGYFRPLVAFIGAIMRNAK